jgi:hypothetical protein
MSSGKKWDEKLADSAWGEKLQGATRLFNPIGGPSSYGRWFNPLTDLERVSGSDAVRMAIVACVHEAIISFLRAMFVVIVFVNLTGTDLVWDALFMSAAVAITSYVAMSVRTYRYLTCHGNTLVTLVYMWHGDFGYVMGLLYLIIQFGAYIAGAAAVNSILASGIPADIAFDVTNGGKYNQNFTITTTGGFFFYFMGVVTIAFYFAQNHKAETRSRLSNPMKYTKAAAGHFATVYGLVTFVSYFIGVWSYDPFLVVAAMIFPIQNAAGVAGSTAATFLGYYVLTFILSVGVTMLILHPFGWTLRTPVNPRK